MPTGSDPVMLIVLIVDTVGVLGSGQEVRSCQCTSMEGRGSSIQVILLVLGSTG